MFRTPPQKYRMVNPSTIVKKQRRDLDEVAREQLEQLEMKSQEQSLKPQLEKCEENKFLENERVDDKNFKVSPQPSNHSKKSSLSSSSREARRKKLQLQAAEAKARIQMDIIDKQLEADLAELNDEYSPQASECDRCPIEKDVEKWVKHSQKELEAQRASEMVNIGPPCPPAGPSAAGTDGPVQQLTSALQNLFTTSLVTNNQNANLLSRVATPRDLPSFSGDPMEWLQFRQAYEESTEVCTFSAKENLWRLRKCLHGAAKEAVTALLVTATSPETIMSTLELQFGNPDVIISRIKLEINKLQPMSHDYHKDIVKFSIKVQNYVAAVRALGAEEYLKGVEVTNSLLSKLPTVLIAKWTDFSYPLIAGGSKERLDILADFLTYEARKTSTCGVSLMGLRTDGYRRNHHDIGATLFAQDGPSKSHNVLLQSQNDNNKKCLFCRGAIHKLTECRSSKKALRKDRWVHAKRYGLCYKCLLSRHDRETCSAAACDMDGCGESHHRLLHYEIPSNKRQSTGDSADAQKATPSPTHTSSTPGAVTHISTSSSGKTLLKVVPVRVHGPNGIITANALLDDGSTLSLISDALAARAGLRGRTETLRVCGAWNANELVCESIVLNFDISGTDNKVYSVSARSISDLNLPEQDMSIVNCNDYSYLRILKDEIICNVQCKPEILLGQDNYHLFRPLKVIVGKRNEPSATRTPLGWCVHGTVRMPHGVPLSQSTLLVSAARVRPDSAGTGAGAAAAEDERALRELHEEVRRSFAIESMGISGKPRQNSEDVIARARLESTATLVDGRWQVGLPWKDQECKMPDSYPTALRRLESVKKKMAANVELAHRYVDRVNHLFKNDFAKEVEVTSSSPKTWFLPHFGVDNPNKKILRLVFDAAAKTKGMSLNDYLLTGPDLLASLFGIMVRFRENRVAVTGDIKDMFLRVKIQPEDQSAFRFLWRGNPEENVKTYAMTSLIFGANCSPFIAQFVKNKNAHRYRSTLPSAVAAICEQHYVDDYIDSLPDEATAIEMVRNIYNIHKQGGFEIRNWTSNSMAVLESVPKETLGTAAVKFKVDQQYEGERTLGLIWYPGEDQLGFDVSLKRIPEDILNGDKIPTKRIMLRVIMSIFDVFGFLSPFTIQGKIMLQDTWRTNISWDENIPKYIFNKWREWIQRLQVINKVRIPRCYLSLSPVGARETERPVCAPVVAHRTTQPPTRPTCYETPPTATALSTNAPPHAQNYTNLQLHVFSDASTKAMCTVAYWRWINEGTWRVRVAPVKPTTVPRLELQAALLAARLADTILKEHKLTTQKRFFWCDSTTVLHWLNNDARNYKTFVANRLGEIDELTRTDEWRYIPTKLNVADVATRETYDDAVFDKEWLKGPTFLYSEESSWPQCILSPEKHDMHSNNLESVTLVQNVPTANLPVPDPERFSSWLRLVRATVVVLMFVSKCKKLTTDLDVATMERAERLLLRHAQSESFAAEISIKKGKPLDRSSRLLTLSPFLDEHGVLRCGGRIDAAPDVAPEIKRPVILDGRHQVARLIVRHHHVMAAHGNQETVVNNLKQKYWLIKIRPTVKYVSSRCMLCRIRKAKAEVPRMGDLPAARMAHHQRPFTFCGVDLFGPMEVAVGRRREKRYGVLFTCLTVRAIHLEIVRSLTTDSLIMALRRMAARRGWPRHLYSDNGTNLKGADTEMKKSIEELDDKVLKNEAFNNNAEWKFIPPVSPHWGGVWERLIRSVKTSLKVVMTERVPRDETLSTFLAEVENIVNSRPLIHVSVEPGSSECLTPNHFILGTSSNIPVIGVFDESDMYLRKQWRKAQRLADMFWRRWVSEVLPTMLPRKKWTQEQKPLQVGDLVLLVDPAAPRNVWAKGLIQQVFPGKDGRVRLVEVKTKNGTLKRPAVRVARIPVADEC